MLARDIGTPSTVATRRYIHYDPGDKSPGYVRLPLRGSRNNRAAPGDRRSGYPLQPLLQS